MAWRKYADYTESVNNVREVIQESFGNHEYLLAAMFGNRWHNSRFDMWQRGTSFASGASQFGPDRHRFRRTANAAGATLSRQTGFRGAKYCARVQRDNANALTNEIFLTHQFDSDECADFAGQTIYITADLKAGANFSAASSKVKCRIDTGTGVNETIDQATGFATGNVSTTLDATITTTPTRYSFGPFAIPANATEFAATLSFVPVGTAGANDFFEVTNIRPNADAPLLYQPLPMAIERSLCGRFAHKLANGLTSSRGYPAIGRTNTQWDVPIHIPQEMRTAPTLFTSSPTWSNTAPGAVNSVGVLSIDGGGQSVITGALTISLVASSPLLANLALQAGTSFSLPGAGYNAYFQIGSAATILLDAEI